MRLWNLHDTNGKHFVAGNESAETKKCGIAFLGFRLIRLCREQDEFQSCFDGKPN